MKSDFVLVSGMVCLSVIAVLAALLLGPDGKWAIGVAMGIIGTICGVTEIDRYRRRRE